MFKSIFLSVKFLSIFQKIFRPFKSRPGPPVRPEHLSLHPVLFRLWRHWEQDAHQQICHQNRWRSSPKKITLVIYGCRKVDYVAINEFGRRWIFGRKHFKNNRLNISSNHFCKLNTNCKLKTIHQINSPKLLRHFLSLIKLLNAFHF